MKQDEVSSAGVLLDTSQWPSTTEELSTYGNGAVDFVCRNLEKNGCKLDDVLYEWQEEWMQAR